MPLILKWNNSEMQNGQYQKSSDMDIYGIFVCAWTLRAPMSPGDQIKILFRYWKISRWQEGRNWPNKKSFCCKISVEMSAQNRLLCSMGMLSSCRPFLSVSASVACAKIGIWTCVWSPLLPRRQSQRLCNALLLHGVGLLHCTILTLWY